jgi:hypothetical protein
MVPVMLFVQLHNISIFVYRKGPRFNLQVNSDVSSAHAPSVQWLLLAEPCEYSSPPNWLI